MKKRHLLFFALAFVLLVFALTGCGDEAADIEGKNVVTFELNGGTLDYKTSSTSTKINYAYHPGTYILDPSTIPNYKLYRNDYNFTGWYTDKACTPQNKWDFKTPFNQESLTLYAGWEKAINFTYSVYYADGENDVLLGSYKVSAGDAFDDWRNFASGRKNFTPIGYFSDRTLTTPWDSTAKHPGGDTDKDVAVYVQYIEGDWKLVDDYKMLCSAINDGKNVYLTKDIDCGGEELSFKTSYNATFEGNGYKVKNFKVTMSSSKYKPFCSIFLTLGAEAAIKNVSFEGATYDLNDVSSLATDVKVAALAVTSEGATVQNVSIVGTLNTNYEGELPKLNSAFFAESTEDSVSGFTATIT